MFSSIFKITECKYISRINEELARGWNKSGASCQSRPRASGYTLPIIIERPRNWRGEAIGPLKGASTLTNRVTQSGRMSKLAHSEAGLELGPNPHEPIKYRNVTQ